jgi:hypothetical protein
MKFFLLILFGHPGELLPDEMALATLRIALHADFVLYMRDDRFYCRTLYTHIIPLTKQQVAND